MKCPYCGAEVTANTKCKYCDSFVEDVKNRQAGFRASTSNNTSTEESTARMLLKAFGIVFGIILGIVVLLAVMFGVLIVAESMLYVLDPNRIFSSYLEETQVNEWVSVTDERGNVNSFEYDGDITVETEDGICTTVLTDTNLLNWLEQNERSINGVDVLFSTDENSNIHTLALSSDTFYVLGEQDGEYLITRDGVFFKTNTEVYLTEGSFYEGYFTYPDVSVYYANETMPYNMLIFDPLCKKKREVTVKDAFSDDEMIVWQIRTGDGWYYCTKELYDFCEEGSLIEKDIYIDKDLGVIYAEE